MQSHSCFIQFFKQLKYASERMLAAFSTSCNVVYRPIDNRSVLAASSNERPLLMRTLEAASFPVWHAADRLASIFPLHLDKNTLIILIQNVLSVLLPWSRSSNVTGWEHFNHVQWWAGFQGLRCRFKLRGQIAMNFSKWDQNVEDFSKSIVAIESFSKIEGSIWPLAPL